MILSICFLDNISRLKAVKSVRDARQDQFPATACITESLKLSLDCNKNCFDVKALEYTLAAICWKRFRDDVFVWPHSIDELDIFFDYMNKVDPTKKNQFTMEVATDTLEFLDLRLQFEK